ncbi:MAG: hypothetical protein K2W91_04675 [Novosphingobium sp.]|nr:hypothetical protein [Novosphingobium sp.]
MGRLRFATLRPEDLGEIALQPSQRRHQTQLPFEDGPEVRALLCAQPVAWVARESGRIVACFGIFERFPGAHGQAWALLAEGIGFAHLELTRFIQTQIAGCGLARLELLAPAPDVEAELVEIGGHPLDLAWRQPTPEMRWAVLLGMEPVHLLRQFGPLGITLMLFERIRAPQTATERMAA